MYNDRLTVITQNVIDRLLLVTYVVGHWVFRYLKCIHIFYERLLGRLFLNYLIYSYFYLQYFRQFKCNVAVPTVNFISVFNSQLLIFWYFEKVVNHFYSSLLLLLAFPLFLYCTAFQQRLSIEYSLFVVLQWNLMGVKYAFSTYWCDSISFLKFNSF